MLNYSFKLFDDRSHDYLNYPFIIRNGFEFRSVVVWLVNNGSSHTVKFVYGNEEVNFFDFFTAYNCHVKSSRRRCDLSFTRHLFNMLSFTNSTKVLLNFIN